MSFNELLTIAVIAAYVAGSAACLANLFSRVPARLGPLLTVAGFALHTVDLALSWKEGFKASLSHGDFSFSLLAWFVVAIFLVAWRYLKLSFLTLIIAPLALALFLTAQALSEARLVIPPSVGAGFFALHVGSLFAAIAAQAVAFGAGVSYLWLERRIKSKNPFGTVAGKLPDLKAFDRANHTATIWGFPLYTLGMVSGFLWARLSWGKIFSFDPKEVAATVVWLVFALLFHQRVALGWRGGKPARMAIWLFALTLASLFGVNLLFQSHHGYSFTPAVGFGTGSLLNGLSG